MSKLFAPMDWLARSGRALTQDAVHCCFEREHIDGCQHSFELRSKAHRRFGSIGQLCRQRLSEGEQERAYRNFPLHVSQKGAVVWFARSIEVLER